MMEAPPDSELSSRTWLVSHGACVQLAVLFLLSLGRSDPYVVAPLVVLYAVRERDRKAMLLYLLLTAGGVFVDVLAILFGATAHTGVVLGQLLARRRCSIPRSSATTRCRSGCRRTWRRRNCRRRSPASSTRCCATSSAAWPRSPPPPPAPAPRPAAAGGAEDWDQV